MILITASDYRNFRTLGFGFVLGVRNARRGSEVSSPPKPARGGHFKFVSCIGEMILLWLGSASIFFRNEKPRRISEALLPPLTLPCGKFCGFAGDLAFGAKPVFAVAAVFPAARLIEFIRAAAVQWAERIMRKIDNMFPAGS